MDAKPHTHEVKVKRQYEYDGGHGGWQVVYGDTIVHVIRGPFLERRIEKAARLAVRLHDAGSIQAGLDVDKKKHLTERARVAAKSTWQ